MRNVLALIHSATSNNDVGWATTPTGQVIAIVLAAILGGLSSKLVTNRTRDDRTLVAIAQLQTEVANLKTIVQDLITSQKRHS